MLPGGGEAWVAAVSHLHKLNVSWDAERSFLKEVFVSLSPAKVHTVDFHVQTCLAVKIFIVFGGGSRVFSECGVFSGQMFIHLAYIRQRMSVIVSLCSCTYVVTFKRGLFWKFFCCTTSLPILSSCFCLLRFDWSLIYQSADIIRWYLPLADTSVSVCWLVRCFVKVYKMNMGVTAELIQQSELEFTTA